METAKDQFIDSRPNWASVLELRELEKVGYTNLRKLMEQSRYIEAGQVLDILKAVGII